MAVSETKELEEVAISVIIPTTCEAARWGSLQRAIRSLRDQRGVCVEVLVVVNGTRFDQTGYEQLRSMKGLRVLYREQGGLPGALRFGRTQVTTPYFAFLDDDDEYMPGALWHRSRPLAVDEGVDYVVSNGYRSDGESEQLVLESIGRIRRDPLRALIAGNWLASCGGLFRSASVSIDFFDGTTSFLEWTLLAYKLASCRRGGFIDVATFRIHESPTSLSKSEAYKHAEVDVLRKILDLDLPDDVRRALRMKSGRANHRLSNHHLRAGNLGRAWRYHIASLFGPGGAGYLAYSRKLLPFWPKERERRPPV